MYISENDLKQRLLTAQIEIVDDILNELAPRYEQALFHGQDYLAAQLSNMKVKYSEYRTYLKQEREKLKQGK